MSSSQAYSDYYDTSSPYEPEPSDIVEELSSRCSLNELLAAVNNGPYSQRAANQSSQSILGKRKRSEINYSQVEGENEEEEAKNETQIAQDEEETTTEPNAKKRRKKISYVWQHVTQVITDDTYVCNVEGCGHKFKTNTSTTNISAHLKNQHNITKHIIPKGDLNNVSLEDLMVMLTVKHNVSFNFMTSEDLRLFAAKCAECLQNGEPLPIRSPEVLKDRISKRCDMERRKIAKEIAGASSISMTADGWSSSNDIPFLGMTGHFITKEWLYRHITLDFVELQGAHSGENMAHAVKTTLEEYGATDKLFALTSDNASNNATLVFHLDQILGGESTKFTSDMKISCLAHVVNLAAQDFLTIVKSGTIKDAKMICNAMSEGQSAGQLSSIQKVRILTIHIGRSPKLIQDWIGMCNVCKIEQLKPKYDVKTRWNSTYDMISRMLRLKPVYNKFVKQEGYKDFIMQEKEWDELVSLAECLKAFHTVTKAVSNDDAMISSSVPMYYWLYEKLYDMVERKKNFKHISAILVEAADNALQKFLKYFFSMDGALVYYVAASFDPRVKHTLWYNQLSENDRQETLSKVKNHLATHYAPVVVQENKPSRNFFLNELLQDSDRSNEPLLDDIEKYFNSPLEKISDGDLTEHEQLLMWWKNHEQDYPRMAKAARDFLAVPASSVPCERLFSQGRDVLSLRRQSLAPEIIREIMTLKSYL